MPSNSYLERIVKLTLITSLMQLWPHAVSSFIKKYANHYKICTFHLLKKVGVSTFTSEVQWLRLFSVACRSLIGMYACADVLGLHLILVTCNTNIACGKDRKNVFIPWVQLCV